MGAGVASLLPAPMALALPALLPTNWPAASLSLLAVQFAHKVKSKGKIKVKGSGQECPLHTT